MKIIKLSSYGIVVTLGEVDAEASKLSGCDRYSGGTITSDLKDGHDRLDKEYDAAMDGIEALILAAAVAGIDIETPAFLEAIETAVEAIANHLVP